MTPFSRTADHARRYALGIAACLVFVLTVGAMMTMRVPLKRQMAGAVFMGEASSSRTLTDCAVLPQGEDPMLVPIADAAMFASRDPFFADAIDDDVVLIYEQKGKMIIWSPSRQKVVNMGLFPR